MGTRSRPLRSLKAESAVGLRTIGSLTLCRSLLEAGLVDRFRVVVFPVITGSSGRERIYDGYPDVALEMVASRTFDDRLQLLEYAPAVLTGPPGGRAAESTPRDRLGIEPEARSTSGLETWTRREPGGSDSPDGVAANPNSV